MIGIQILKLKECFFEFQKRPTSQIDSSDTYLDLHLLRFHEALVFLESGRRRRHLVVEHQLGVLVSSQFRLCRHLVDRSRHQDCRLSEGLPRRLLGLNASFLS